MYNCLISNQSCGGEIIRGSCIHKYRNIRVKTVQEIINQFVYILPIFVWNPSLFCFKVIYEITIDIVYIAVVQLWIDLIFDSLSFFIY